MSWWDVGGCSYLYTLCYYLWGSTCGMRDLDWNLVRIILTLRAIYSISYTKGTVYTFCMNDRKEEFLFSCKKKGKILWARQNSSRHLNILVHIHTYAWLYKRTKSDGDRIYIFAVLFNFFIGFHFFFHSYARAHVSSRAHFLWQNFIKTPHYLPDRRDWNFYRGT